MTKLLSKEFLKNMAYAFGAQSVTLGLSFLMSLVIPKILGVTEYGYWQLFLFYTTYVGFFHFGLTDGIYLKLGGKEYQKLDSRLISSQFWILCFIQVMLMILFLVFLPISPMERERKIAISAATVYMLFANLTWYIGYIFQATNRIKTYALSVIIDRAVFFVIVISTIFFSGLQAAFFIYTYVFAKILALVYSVLNSREVIGFHVLPPKQGFAEAWDSIKIGINLTISNVSSIFTLGIGRAIVDYLWGIEAFGKFSLALSLTNFFLAFIRQISLVLFPTLRRAESEQINYFYDLSRRLLGIILPLVLVIYTPIKFLLGLWLPQYKESLRYLALLLPLCTFDGKMQLLCNTFFKVLRKERFLLHVNLISLGISTVLAVIGGFGVHNINFILIGMVISIAFRSVFSEIYLTKILEEKVYDLIKDLISEIGIAFLFIIVSWWLPNKISFIIMIFLYVVYLHINKQNLDFVYQNLIWTRTKKFKL